jgi:hypothetical protein
MGELLVPFPGYGLGWLSSGWAESRPRRVTRHGRRLKLDGRAKSRRAFLKTPIISASHALVPGA